MIETPPSPEYEEFERVLSGLPDSFVLCEPTETPVIPPGHHGLVYYIASGAPATLERFRDLTWDLAVISPVTDMKAAGRLLWSAVNQVIDVLEAEKTVRWTTVSLEPYNTKLWCYSLQVTMYAEKTEDAEPMDAPVTEEEES